jgi:hypothetical protein
MPSKNFNRMIDLGEWIAKYLDPKIGAWEYRELAEEFIRIYNIDFCLKEDDASLTVLEGLKEFGNSFNPSAYLNELKEKLLFEVKKECEVSNELDETNYIEEERTQKVSLWIESCKNEIGTLGEVKVGLKQIFLEISNDKKPYNLTLNRLLTTEASNVSYTIMELSDAYQGISTALFIDRGEPKKIKKFNRDKDLEFFLPENSPSFFPWEVAVSRIFFDFLFLGGQDYFGFCGFCSKFFVARRKTSKIYCSDNCRASYRNEIVRQKKIEQQK